MGNADSKNVADQSETLAVNQSSKESQCLPSSFEANDNNSHAEEKKEFDQLATPRVKHKKFVGDGSKSGASGEGPEAAAEGKGGSPTKGGSPDSVVQARDDDNASALHISDDQIHVNLAMADLMAYLQVVANNSNHLPLTRRDDPELDRTVSSLTSEEYARKSAAFIPSDVRVIAGVFTRYGRVWDLPTSEEYNACDGAHEPGRSYGGACCNAMLKVLYDAANETAEAGQMDAASAALFDDDEDDDDSTGGTSSILGKSHKSGYSMEYASANTSSISWADLLRKMKAEIKEIEYAQAPKITTTRKMDLSKPFSLVPENFDPKQSKKRSLLIGCNYVDAHGAELKASHDDIRSMKDYIVNVHGFPEDKGLMKVLLDNDGYEHPTFLNIIEAFKVLSEESQPGDAVFIQFSGHGGRVLDAPIDAEAESYDEVIVPTDYAESGLIRDTLIFKTLLAPMRYGVTVTMLIDSCDTGMSLELPYSWGTKNERRDSAAKLSPNDDFSFVRFLKVVKTLYESSTFTQLGRTVRTALNSGFSMEHGSDEKDDDGIQMYDDSEAMGSIRNRKSSIFDAIADACNGGNIAADDIIQSRSKDSARSFSIRSKDTLTRRDGSSTQSLLEQVMNCTLMTQGEDDFSDEDTFQTRTEDDGSFDDTINGTSVRSFDSMDDERERGGRKRRRKRGKKH